MNISRGKVHNEVLVIATTNSKFIGPFIQYKLALIVLPYALVFDEIAVPVMQSYYFNVINKPVDNDSKLPTFDCQTQKVITEKIQDNKFDYEDIEQVIKDLDTRAFDRDFFEQLTFEVNSKIERLQLEYQEDRFKKNEGTAKMRRHNEVLEGDIQALKKEIEELKSAPDMRGKQQNLLERETHKKYEEYKAHETRRFNEIYEQARKEVLQEAEDTRERHRQITLTVQKEEAIVEERLIELEKAKSELTRVGKELLGAQKRKKEEEKKERDREKQREAEIMKTRDCIEEDGESLCLKCKNTLRDAVFAPCFHSLYCRGCCEYGEGDKCPYCKEPIDNVIILVRPDHNYFDLSNIL